MIDVQIRNSAGTVLGPGPLNTITRWRQTRRLDQAGEIQFELPAANLRGHEIQSDGNPLLHPKRYAYAYTVQDGAMANVGAGIVEEVEINMGGRGAVVQSVRGGDLLTDLSRKTCFVTNEIDYAYNINGSTTAASVTLSVFASDWTFSGGATVMEFYGRFIHETVLNALRSIANETGEHFRLGVGKQIVWLGTAADFVDCGVRAEMNVDSMAAEVNDDICLITGITRRKESWNLYTSVFPSGAGQTEDKITLEYMTEWPDGHPFVMDISSIVGGGATVTVTTATDHGLTTGDDPSIEGTLNFDGQITNVTVTGTTTFTYASGIVATETNTGVVIGHTSRTIGGDFWIVDRDANRLTNYTKELLYGYHGKAISFRNISPLSSGGADLAAAANALVRATYNWMIAHGEPARFYDLTVTKLKQTVYPGQTIRVVCRQFVSEQHEITGAETRGVWLDIDEDLYILEVVEEHTTSGTEVVGLTVATVDRWPEDGVSTVLDSVQTLVDASTHPQPGNSVDTVSREQPIDADNDFATRFRLPDYVQRVRGCTLWFRVDQLTLPVRSVGGTSTSTGPSSATSSDASSASSSGSSSEAGTTGTNLAAGDPHSHNFTTPAHTHNIEHDHDIPHTHDTSASIVTVYGVFRELLINTYAYTDLDIEINGATPTNSVVAEGSGWYSLDLLPDVASHFNGVPFQVFNEVVFSDGLSSINIANISGDGTTVTVTTAGSHGLSSGVNIWVDGTTYHDGVYTEITVTGGTGFTFLSSVTNAETVGAIKQYKTANIYAEFENRTVLQSLG